MSDRHHSPFYPSGSTQDESTEHVYHQFVPADNTQQHLPPGFVPAPGPGAQNYGYTYSGHSIPVVNQPGLIPASPYYSQAQPYYQTTSPVSSNGNRQSGIFLPVGDEHLRKEAVSPSQFEAGDSHRGTFTGAGSTILGRDDENRKGLGGRIWGLPVWLLIVFVGATIICLAVGLGVGLGLGLKKSNPSTQSGSGAAAGSPSFSKTGAWNDTSISLASTPLDDVNGQIQLFFQHHTGEIRWMAGANDGTFSGGGTGNVIATDAKNATPISAVVQVIEGKTTVSPCKIEKTKKLTGQWHLVYIDNTNKVRELTRTSADATWSQGPLDELNIQPLDEPVIAFALCDNAYMRNPTTISSRGKIPTPSTSAYMKLTALNQA
jgi:hypothetical protein